MKKEILERLKTKFPGVSDSILSRIAENLAKTATKPEDVEPAVEGVTFQQVIDSEADRRSTAATQTAVANYEKKHGLKDGQKVDGDEPNSEPTPGEKPQDGGGDNTAALLNEIKALRADVANLKSGKVAESRKQRLDEILGSAPAPLRARIEKDFARLSSTFKDEDDYNGWLEDVKTDTEAAASEESSKGAVLGKPGGGLGGTPSKKEPTQAELDEVANQLNL